MLLRVTRRGGPRRHQINTHTCMHAYTERHNVCGGGETFASVCVDVGGSGDDYLRSSQMHSTAHRARERTQVEERKRALCVCVCVCLALARHFCCVVWWWCDDDDEMWEIVRSFTFSVWGALFCCVCVCGFVLTASSRLHFFTTTTARRNMKIMAAKFWEFVVVVVVVVD